MVVSEAFNTMKTNYITMIAVALLLVMTIQPVMAYEVRSTEEGLNLYDLFVVNTFGNVGLTVIVLALLLSIILMMGGISQITSMAFIMLFLFSMGIGYGGVFIPLIIFSFAMIWLTIEIRKFLGGGVD